MSAQTPDEWHRNAARIMSLALASQIQAQQTTTVSRQAHTETQSEHVLSYEQIHTSLENKVQATQGLIDKLKTRAGSVENTLARLNKSVEELEKAHGALNLPLKLCDWRMSLRHMRPHQEQVRDIVEIALEEEKQGVVDLQSQLSNAIGETSDAMAWLQVTLGELNKDVGHKTQALDIDMSCLYSTMISRRGTEEEIGPSKPLTSVSRQSSARHSQAAADLYLENNRNEEKRHQSVNNLIHSAANAEAAAQEQSVENQQLMAKCRRLTHEMGCKTENALQVWISKTKQVVRKLEDEILKTEQKIATTEHTLSETRAHLDSLQKPIHLCSSHAALRKMRVPREEISDPVSATLLEQSQSLTKLDQRLHRQQEMEERSLVDLQKSKTLLVSDFQHKRSALRIDLSILGVQPHSSSRLTKTRSVPPGDTLWLQASSTHGSSDFPQNVKGSSRADPTPSEREFAPPGRQVSTHGPNSATRTGSCSPPGKRQEASPMSAHRTLPGGRASLAFGPRVPGSPKSSNKVPRRSSPPGSPSRPQPPNTLRGQADSTDALLTPGQKSNGSSSRRSSSHGDLFGDLPSNVSVYDISSPRSPPTRDEKIRRTRQALLQNSKRSVASDSKSPRSSGDVPKTAAFGRGFQMAQPMVKSSHSAVGMTSRGRSSYSGNAPTTRSASANGEAVGSSLGSSLYRKNSGWLWKPHK